MFEVDEDAALLFVPVPSLLSSSVSTVSMLVSGQSPTELHTFFRIFLEFDHDILAKQLIRLLNFIS